MPFSRIDRDLTMHYLVDDYTDPWRETDTVLMIHGNAECGKAWYGWVPRLAREYRVVRPDTRGFGQSTPMPRDFQWSLDLMIDDYLELLATLEIPRFHLVAAKFGGTIARHFAARHPDRVRSLTVIGTPPPAWDRLGVSPADTIAELEEIGVHGWVSKNMGSRLGSRFPPAGVQWWTQMMSDTALSTLIGFSKIVPYTDILADLPRIRCPTLVITTEGSALGTVEATRNWQEKIPNSQLLVLPGDSYHVAATDPDLCVEATIEFIARAQRVPTSG